MAGPTPPIVSVIIPAYGLAHLVGEALNSLIAQDLDAWEAIIVDDGSPDDIASAMLPFADDPRIRLLQTDNGGVAAARNRAIRHARGAFIALLDGDDRYEPNYLSAMVSALRADPGLAFVTCDAVNFGESHAGVRFSALMPQTAPITLSRVLQREFNVFIATMLRVEAFNDVGGFNETLRFAEDFDLWIRLLERGWRAHYVPHALARYRRRNQSASSQVLNMHRALVRIYRAAAERLADRPEGAIARSMAAEAQCNADWEEGQAMILRGETAAGLKLLRQGGGRRRSGVWAVALPLMRVLPPLARPILAWREKNNSEKNDKERSRAFQRAVHRPR